MTVTTDSVTKALGGAVAPRKSRVAVLPEGPAAQLKAAHDRRREDGFEPLYLLVVSLRSAGWSLASIAQPLGVTRESVRLWHNHGVDLGLPVVTMPAPAPTGQARERLRREKMTIARVTQRSREQKTLDELLPKLKAVQEEAQSLRGPSSTNPEKAKASAEYTALLDEALRRGVRSSRLASELGIQVVTIYARLRRGGYRQAAPSEEAPQWANGPLAKAS